MSQASSSRSVSEDLPSLDEVFLRHRGAVRRTLARLGVEASHLDDATQDVFVVLLRRIDDYRHGSPVGAWLHGIARRVAAGYRRSRERTHRLHDALGEHARPTEEVDPSIRADASRILDNFLGGLGSEEVETFVLSEVHGLTGPELAREAKIPLNTAYSRMRRVRQRLRATVAGERDQALLPVPLLATQGQGHRLGSLHWLGASAFVVSLGLNAWLCGHDSTNPPEGNGGARPPGLDDGGAQSVAAVDDCPISEDSWVDTPCGAQVGRCRSVLRDCEQTIEDCDFDRRLLPVEVLFEIGENDPQSRAELQPLVERAVAAFDGIDAGLECRSGVCKVEIVSLAKARPVVDGAGPPPPHPRAGRILQLEPDPLLALVGDPEYAEQVGFRYIKPPRPATELSSGEGVWLQSVFLQTRASLEALEEDLVKEGSQ